jgi:hypothetical protein
VPCQISIVEPCLLASLPYCGAVVLVDDHVLILESRTL